MNAMNHQAKDQQQEKPVYKPKLMRASFSWNIVFKKLSIKAEDIANLSEVPITVFKHANSKITPDQFIRIWKAVEELDPDSEYMGLEAAQTSLKNTINLAICALLFSKNLSHAIKNLNNFQALMMPAHFHSEDHGDETTINVTLDVSPEDTPRSMSYFVLVFLVELLRTCTGRPIVPIKVLLNNDGENKPRYIEYFGTEPQNANNLSITIKREEMEKPFLSNNKQIWQFFKPLLQRRVDLIDKSTRYTGRVKGYLFGKLSRGQSDIKSVSEYFSMTPRTLQRRLFEEDTSFRAILDETRSEMAFIYLSTTDFAAYEISLLLGFEDKNSFYRAFQRWTGTTPQAARTSLERRKEQLYYSPKSNTPILDKNSDV